MACSTTRAPLTDIDELCINTNSDALDRGESRRQTRLHPGTQMELAPGRLRSLAKALLSLRHERPDWQNRDRFVLSNGHASMTLYSLAAPEGSPGCRYRL